MAEQLKIKIIGDVNYLKLEDITRKFRRPCVLDVKMKANEHDPYSDNFHQIFEISSKLGFLLDGLQVYDHMGHEYISYQKKFGRSLSEDGVKQVLHQFVNGDSPKSNRLVDSFLCRLFMIKKWLEQQQMFTFFRSSLLFVYDASYFDDAPNYVSSRSRHEPAECQMAVIDRECLKDLTDVRLVDFPKVYSTSQKDVSYIKSLENLIRCFEQLKNRSRS